MFWKSVSFIFECVMGILNTDFSLEIEQGLKTFFKTMKESQINIFSFNINTILFIMGLILTTVLFLLVAVTIYKKLNQKPSFNKMLMSTVYEVHQTSASLNPRKENVKRCIQLLNQCPFLVNHPMPPYNFTPFLRACWSGNTPLVRYMLKNNADIQSRLTTGETPFYLAAYRVSKNKTWDPSVINLLYSAGCSLSDLTAKGSSALHQAARSGNVTLTQWLLSHNAHHSLQPSKFTPYDIAIKYRDLNHQSIACLLHVFCPEMVQRSGRFQNRSYETY